MNKNISHNEDKTRIIVKELWGKATPQQRNDIKEFAEYKSDNSIYYTTKHGRISKKLAQALLRVFPEVSEDELLGKDTTPLKKLWRISVPDGTKLPDDLLSQQQYASLLAEAAHGNEDAKMISQGIKYLLNEASKKIWS